MMPFHGKRIFVLEDEALVAMLLEDMLKDLGCQVVGPAHDIVLGEDMARRDAIDGAILDVNVNGYHSDVIAAVLKARGIPYAIASGFSWSEDEHVVRLDKPYDTSDVEAALLGLFK